MFVYQRFGHTSDARRPHCVTPIAMNATILCYHKVGPLAEEGRRLNIEPIRLRSHVRFFARRNIQFLVAGDLAGSWQDGIVCFTFDDAYDSTMVHAPGIFEEFGVRASFYAVPSLVGGRSEWDKELSRPLADWDLLRKIQASGHEIGNHSLTHPFLAKLSTDQQLVEIASSHERFLAEGLLPRSFCFPYGSYDSHTLDQLKATGYEVGLALGKRPARSSDNRLSLPRIVVAYSDTLPMLLYKIHLKPLLRRSIR